LVEEFTVDVNLKGLVRGSFHRRFEHGIGFDRRRRDGGSGFSVFGEHEKTSGDSKGNSSGESIRVPKGYQAAMIAA
jgi:hypothetical protein